MPQNHMIEVTHGDAVTGELTLSDRGHTFVDPGDIVTWKIKHGSGVEAITSITDDAGSVNVFDPNPAPVGGSSNWKGTVKTVVPKGSLEEYTICWETPSGQTPPCYDPKIQLNP